MDGEGRVARFGASERAREERTEGVCGPFLSYIPSSLLTCCSRHKRRPAGGRGRCGRTRRR
jgi:hypothetical protein